MELTSAFGRPRCVKVSGRFIGLVMLAACGNDGRGPAAVETENAPVDATTTVPYVEGLMLELTFSTPEVASGSELPSRLTVENPTDRDITDPGCMVGEGRSALVPADDLDAELWLQTTVECGGPYVYATGFVGEYEGPTFFATTKYGEPLPPGDYIAVLETPRSPVTTKFGEQLPPVGNSAAFIHASGLPQRLEYPIRVVQPAP